jgi:glutamine synthetase
MTPQEIVAFIGGTGVRFVDLRFTDTLGKEQHVTVTAPSVDERFLVEGKMFDGSSIVGWKHIEDSDMILKPDPATALVDPFTTERTLVLWCDVHDPRSLAPYARDPRSIARRAEEYLRQSGVADTAYFGPEHEFFVFDDVRWSIEPQRTFYSIDSREGIWNSGREYPEGNRGHRPRTKAGYMPTPPIDALQEFRNTVVCALMDLGLRVEVHHHEVATGGQCEIGLAFNTLVRKADETQILKYVVFNVAARMGLTATFMPKPLVGDNGSGMHVHTSLSKDGQNLFAGREYGDLSPLALHYIGGIIQHAKALNALLNPTTNSYRRLVPGFEAPVKLAYSARNRSASIRIPYAASAKGRRLEIRFPDGLANPYLGFSALLLAGLDGVARKLDPGPATDRDLYDLSPEEDRKIPQVAYSLEEALDALDRDRAFLTAGGVFTDEAIDAYIAIKREEVSRVRMWTVPVEFDLYYSL